MARDNIDFETFSSTHRLILLILVKMGSVAHAYAHKVLNDLLRDKLKSVGIAKQYFIPYGSAHVQGREGKKRADESCKPKQALAMRGCRSGIFRRASEAQIICRLVDHGIDWGCPVSEYNWHQSEYQADDNMPMVSGQHQYTVSELSKCIARRRPGNCEDYQSRSVND